MAHKNTVEIVFDDRNPNWSRHSRYNIYYLRTLQNYLNDRLAHQGHLFLNEVYDALGLPRTPQGAIDGWLMTEGNCIDLGIVGVINSFGDRVGYAEGLTELKLQVITHGTIYQQI